MSKNNVDFKPKWELECGVQITSRCLTTNAVESVVCLFCRTFGKEDVDDDTIRQRKRSKNIQTYCRPWRIDKLKNHNSAMHATKWEKYQTCSIEEKKKFFDTVLESNTDTSTNVFDIPTIETKEITVEKEIIEVIVDDLLCLADEDEEQIVQADKLEDILGFEPINDDDDDDDDIIQNYRAIVTSSFHYETILTAIGNGLSFRQTVNILENIQNLTGLTSKFGNISQQKVSTYVRIYCGESFQVIAEAIRNCWAFTISLEGGNKATAPYLDIRLRFVLQHELFNVHLIACPMYESHTNMSQLTSKILHVLCPDWQEKVIGITTDCVSNLTGCHVEMATQIEQEAKKGFFRIWCAVHQLDLTVQDRFKSIFDDQFVHLVQGVSRYLRRQKNLAKQMDSTCPRFETKWLSMYRLLDWLIENRLQVQAHFQEQNPLCQPPNEWWIEVYALAEVVGTIRITFQELQDNRFLLDDQTKCLEKLRENLMRISGTCTSTGDELIQQHIPDLFQLGCFRITLVSAELFLFNLNSDYVVQLLIEYRNCQPVLYKSMLIRIANLFLHLIHGIFTLQPQGNDDTNSDIISSAPAVMPLQVAENGIVMFTTSLTAQIDRLDNTFTKPEIRNIQIQYNAFARRFHHDQGFRYLVQNTSHCKHFADAWGWLYKDYPMLVCFYGGLATTLPGITSSTVESDPSMINWQTDEYRTLVSDLSLEGFLHAIQMKDIKSIRTILSQEVNK
jgi:hypothetical protein